jgi:hypothetical protein
MQGRCVGGSCRVCVREVRMYMCRSINECKSEGIGKGRGKGKGI